MFTINSSPYEPSPDILYTSPLSGADPGILFKGTWIFFFRGRGSGVALRPPMGPWQSPGGVQRVKRLNFSDFRSKI